MSNNKQCRKKHFVILATNLSVLHNYFDDLTELFSELYVAKSLDTSTKNRFFRIII